MCTHPVVKQNFIMIWSGKAWPMLSPDISGLACPSVQKSLVLCE